MLDSELGFYLLEKMKNTSLNVEMSDVVEEAVNNGSTIQTLVSKLVELKAAKKEVDAKLEVLGAKKEKKQVFKYKLVDL
jgi:hypothetical protein